MGEVGVSLPSGRCKESCCGDYGDPAARAARATAYLRQADELLLTALVDAETVYVLESYYEVPRGRVAELVRAILTFEPVRVVDRDLLLRAVEVYETHRIDFTEAYLVACAETAGVGEIASFDRSIDRLPTVQRIEPLPSRRGR